MKKPSPNVHYRARALAAETALEHFLFDYGSETRCRACGNEAWWLRLNDKNRLLNADLSMHKCPEYKDKQRQKEEREIETILAQKKSRRNTSLLPQKRRLLMAERLFYPLGWDEE